LEEPTVKKATSKDLENIHVLENKVYDLMSLSMDLIHTRFIPLRNKHSPKVSAISSNMNMVVAPSKEEQNLEKKGFLSCHLCLNAQTQELHTEHDASYTIIAVPNKISSTSPNETSNRAKFEIMVNTNELLIIPMHPGTIICYSGYMLTHRQQIVDIDTLSLPFVNVVAYNSKRLFSNLMESFRRDIKSDKKSLVNQKR